MPRPPSLECDGRSGPLSIHDQNSEPANALETHLHGLFAAFQAVQSQQRDVEIRFRLTGTPLKACKPAPNACSARDVIAKSPCSSGEATETMRDHEVTPAWETNADHTVNDNVFAAGMAENDSHVAVSPDDAQKQFLRRSLMTASFHTVWSSEAEATAKKKIQSQFYRLDPNGKGLISDDTLIQVMLSFSRGRELENLAETMRYLTDNVETNSKGSGACLDEPNRSGSVNTIIPGLNLSSFYKLVKGEGLERASPRVKRDIRALRHALKAEERHVLYREWVGVHFAFPPIVSERTTVLLDVIPGILIVLNALVIGISSDIAENHVAWDIIEFIFLSFYITEAVFKMCLFGCRCYFMGPDRIWNRFDCFCICTSIIDATVTYSVHLFAEEGESIDLSTFMLIRMFRLARLARLVRTLRFPLFRELKLMVMGVVSGIRVLFWAIVLLITCVYIFGVVCRNLLGETHPELSSVPAASFTLFRCFTDGCAAYDGTPLSEKLAHEFGIVFVLGYVLVFMVITVGVFNLIMAIFIDNVMDSQLQRKRHDISTSGDAMEVKLKDCLLRLLLDSDDTGIPQSLRDEVAALQDKFTTHEARVRSQFEILAENNIIITRTAFNAFLAISDFAAVLEEADIDCNEKGSLFDTIDADMGGWLSIRETYDGLMKLRGPVSKGDIISVGLRVNYITRLLHHIDAQSGGDRQVTSTGPMTPLPES